MIALVVGGIAFAIRWSDRTPGQASLEEAVEGFRSSTSGTGTSDEGVTSSTTSPSRLRLPADGVYVYDGDGEEVLQLLGTAQPQGPQLPAIVTTTGDGCFTFTIEYNEHHSQDWYFCEDDGTLVETGGSTTQEFDFVAFQVDNVTLFECDPPGLRVDPDAEPGDSWMQECTGHSDANDTTTVSSGTNTFVGVDDLTVDGETIATLHYRQERTIGGDQSGTTSEDVWFAADSMLPVREERSSRIESPAPAPLGSVTYTEEGWWQLADLEPLR